MVLEEKMSFFFATMGDGDYIDEMIETSVKMFNAKETLEVYGLTE